MPKENSGEKLKIECWRLKIYNCGENGSGRKVETIGI